MTTVVSRTFRSSPHRDALQTWDAIVELLTQGKDGTARSELRAVTGVAASLIPSLRHAMDHGPGSTASSTKTRSMVMMPTKKSWGSSR